MSNFFMTPHDRQLVDHIIQTWKNDPQTETLNVSDLTALVKQQNPEWIVEESRVYALLDMFGLLPPSEQKLFTYADKIRSSEAPEVALPDAVTIKVAQDGKGLYATKNISSGTVLWTEGALFGVPSLAEVLHMEKGSLCTWCGKKLEGVTRKNLVKCSPRCENRYCCRACKKQDKLHALSHGEPLLGNRFNSDAFAELKKHAFAEKWNGLYAVALIQASILLDKNDTRAKQFHSMAGICQEERQERKESFLQEQQDSELQHGYALFQAVFPKWQGSYADFSYMLGTYNLNNLGSRMYLLYSHLNHNCEPNVVHTTKDNVVEVAASRDIKEGEQLYTTYVDPELGGNERREILRVNWGFLCGCSRCNDHEQ